MNLVDEQMIEEINEETIQPDDDEKQQKKHFSFDRNFQEKIVQVLFHDKAWASQIQEILDPSFFEYAYLQVITQIYFNYNNKYREYPSIELLSTLIAESFKLKKIKTDQLLIAQVRAFLPKLVEPTNVGDFAFVKEKTTDFCKRVVLQQALEVSVSNIQRGDYDGVAETIRKALAKGMTNTKGLDLFNPADIDARYNGVFRRTIPTGLDELDGRTILNGGLGQGEIGFVVAMSGVGKSHLLTHFGAEAMRRGFNVLHYTFELNEGAIAIRYDSNLIGVDSSYCFEHKEAIKKMYEDNKDVFGRLIIKHYPTNQANVNVLRGHIEKLKTDGFSPDLILVDYAGIMRSTEKSDLLRIELKKITEELRALADEVRVPLWTALQANKEAAGNDIVDMTNMAESFAQAAAADFILGLARKSEQKSTGIGTLFIAKNRAGKDGLKFNIHLDTAQSRLRFLNSSETPTSGYTSKAGKEAWKRIQDGLDGTSMKLENL
jgi:hypothetical protein